MSEETGVEDEVKCSNTAAFPSFFATNIKVSHIRERKKIMKCTDRSKH